MSLGEKWRVDPHESIWLVRPTTWGDVHVPGGAERLSSSEAVSRLERWFSSGFGGAEQTLTSICLALEGAFPGNDSPEPEWLVATVRRAILSGRLLAVRIPLQQPIEGFGQEEEVSRAAPTTRQEEKTWIEVVLLDEGSPPGPVPFVKYRIELQDGTREGVLDANGRARLTELDPGECQVTFPSLDAEAWVREGGQASSVPRGGAGTTRKIRQGETTEALASASGLFWGTVWDHSKNEALRERRRAPNVLLPGDEVFLPERVERMEACSTGRVHRFRRRGIPSELRLQCLDEEQKPRANVPYRLVGQGVDHEGQLDSEGWLRAPIPPELGRLTLFLGEDGEVDEIDLLVGHLDPLDEPTGIHDRLRNLGYYDGPSSTEITADLRAAIRWFQKDAGLPLSGDVDEALRDALRERHHA